MVTMVTIAAIFRNEFGSDLGWLFPVTGAALRISTEPWSPLAAVSSADLRTMMA